MLTALTIEKKSPTGFWDRLCAGLRTGKPRLEERAAAGVTLRHIRFEQKGKRVPWEEITELAGREGRRLLCSRLLPLPPGSSLFRFVPRRYGTRMAQNAALGVLERARILPGRLEIALYDPCARYPVLAEQLLFYTSRLHVVTGNSVGYRECERELMEEYGASLLLEEDANRLARCAVVVAPDRIVTPLPASSRSLVFTGAPPAAQTGGVVFGDYQVSMPEEYKPLCPKELGETYLLAALYELCGRDELGYLTPDACLCAGKSHTIAQLAEILLRQTAPEAEEYV